MLHNEIDNAKGEVGEYYLEKRNRQGKPPWFQTEKVTSLPSLVSSAPAIAPSPVVVEAIFSTGVEVSPPEGGESRMSTFGSGKGGGGESENRPISSRADYDMCLVFLTLYFITPAYFFRAFHGMSREFRGMNFP